VEKNGSATSGRRRWYDKHEGLSAALDKLRSTDDARQERIVEEVKKIITKRDPDLIERVCAEFPLSPFRRRWYDKNPYLWLVVNALRYADDRTIREVVAHIGSK
jgi:hypothetical protein